MKGCRGIFVSLLLLIIVIIAVLLFKSPQSEEDRVKSGACSVQRLIVARIINIDKDRLKTIDLCNPDDVVVAGNNVVVRAAYTFWKNKMPVDLPVPTFHYTMSMIYDDYGFRATCFRLTTEGECKLREQAPNTLRH